MSQNQNGAGKKLENNSPAENKEKVENGTGSMAEAINKQKDSPEAPVKTKKPKMKTGKKVLIALGSVFLVLCIAVYSVYAIIDSRISGKDTPAGTLPEEIKAPETYTKVGGNDYVCGLICGIDYDLNDDGTKRVDQIGRTDLIIYLLYDMKNNKAYALQIPRDIYVGDVFGTGGTGKINSLYHDSPDPNNRMSALATTIYDQLKLPTDFYVTIDMDALKEVINIKGSIEVFVPIEVNDPANGGTIEPGWRHFSGEEADFYLRNRKSTTYKDQGDIMRLQMQQYFYSALFREFKTLAPADLMLWMNHLLYRCNTDGLNTLQLIDVAQNALSIKSQDITFVRPAAQVVEVQPNGQAKQSMLHLLPEETAEILNKYFRPDGHDVPASELDIQIPENIVDDKGTVPESIRTMMAIEMTETQTAAKVEQAEKSASNSK